MYIYVTALKGLKHGFEIKRHKTFITIQCTLSTRTVHIEIVELI